jgi:hypothetical protein
MTEKRRGRHAHRTVVQLSALQFVYSEDGLKVMRNI